MKPVGDDITIMSTLLTCKAMYSEVKNFLSLNRYTFPTLNRSSDFYFRTSIHPRHVGVTWDLTRSVSYLLLVRKTPFGNASIRTSCDKCPRSMGHKKDKYENLVNDVVSNNSQLTISRFTSSHAHQGSMNISCTT